ncbi:MAG: glycine cleavage system protein GcvH [Erysipelothrix sp.]|nr:glycine cleavage system protein GcvH [Erysipelothrix sp.]
MIVKAGYYYLKTHEWVKFLDDNTALIGISDFAQDALGDIVYISLPEVNDEISVNKSFCDVESVKAVSDVFSPVSGVIIEVNEALDDEPELINEAPYDQWIIKVSGRFDKEHLLDAKQYEALIQQEE